MSARSTVRESSQPESLHAPLQRKASGPILDDLLRMELELHRRYRAHLASQAQPRPSAAKAAIVAALRSKH